MLDTMAPTTVPARSDASVADDVAAVLARPRDEPADSFVLHAPLEVMARRALLAHVPPAARTDALDRLRSVGDRYRELGPWHEPARPPATVTDVGTAVLALGRAIEGGDLDAVDELAPAIAGVATARDLAPLADVVVPRLTAAAHGSIFLWLLGRTAPRSRDAIGALWPLAREIARHDWRLTWQDDAELGDGGTAVLVDRLAAVPILGRPGSDFVYPLMHQVEVSGVARAAIEPGLGASSDVAEVGRALSRLAAWSMLHDDPEAAPYGWTHTLTIPQAVVGLAPACADPVRALAVAATHVAGFRAALGRGPLPTGYQPDPTGLAPVAALGAEPPVAAASTYHADPAQLEVVTAELAGRAAVHEDAHLAKYVLACFDAAHADPPARRLFLAAASSLVAWWGAVSD